MAPRSLTNEKALRLRGGATLHAPALVLQAKDGRTLSFIADDELVRCI